MCCFQELEQRVIAHQPRDKDQDRRRECESRKLSLSADAQYKETRLDVQEAEAADETSKRPIAMSTQQHAHEPSLYS
jgi:hypothetical protein